MLASCRRWSTVRGPLFLRGRTPLDRVTPWGVDRARSYRAGAHKQPYAEAGRPSAPRRALFGPGDTLAHACTGCGMSGCSYIRQQPFSCSREVRPTYLTPRVRARPRTPTNIFPALLAVSRSANRSPFFLRPGAPRPPPPVAKPRLRSARACLVRRDRRPTPSGRVSPGGLPPRSCMT